MMTNLFSVFDPSTSIMNMSINWTSTFLGIMIIPMSMWLIPSRHTMAWNTLLMKLHNEFKTLLGDKIKGSTFMFI